MQMTDKTPKSRLFQFRLRTLLIVLVLSVPLLWFAIRMEKARKQSETVEAVQELGGVVHYEWDSLNGPERRILSLGDLKTPKWIRSLLGKEFSDVVAVQFADLDVSESDLRHLKGFPELRHLELHDTELTGIQNLKALTKLRYLSLFRTGVTPERVKDLQEALPNCIIEVNRRSSIADIVRQVDKQRSPTD